MKVVQHLQKTNPQMLSLGRKEVTAYDKFSGTIQQQHCFL